MAAKQRKPSEVLNVVNDARKGFDVGELAGELLQAFGGPREFARLYRTEYDEGTAGSVARQKQLEGVVRILGASAAKQKPTDDEDSLSDAELENVLLGLLAKRNVTVDTGAAVDEAAHPDATPQG